MPDKQKLTTDDRKRILEEEISRQAQAGWRVISRTDTTAQLAKDQGPNGCLVIFLFLFFIIPGILYLLLYKGTQSLYLEVDEYGEIKRITQG